MTPRILELDWSEGRDRLLSVRHEVFVVEQKVPAEIEEDEHDPLCVHFLACDDTGTPIGTARLSAGGKVGRLAVLAEHRGRGLGRALMLAVIAAAEKKNLPELRLHAQTHSIPFYESLGFRAEGPVFDEAGIPHRRMQKPLA